jgi:hypothetical protein
MALQGSKPSGEVAIGGGNLLITLSSSSSRVRSKLGAVERNRLKANANRNERILEAK